MAATSAKLGRPFLPWQAEVANVTGELLPGGAMAYPLVVLIVPRRAGKTVAVLANSIQRCAALPAARVWYTSVTGSLATTTFREEWAPAVRASVLNPHVRIRFASGSESMAVGTAGSRFALFPPNERALHSQDSDVVTIDEAWAFDDLRGSMLEASIRPTMLTRPARQLWIVSAGGTAESTWLLRYRDLGRNLARTETSAGRYTLDPDQGIAFFEWHPPVLTRRDGTIGLDPAVDLDDPAVWADTHPAVGFTISADTLAQDKLTSPAGVFYRSILNVFSTSSADRVIPATDWEACQDPDLIIPDDALTLAFDVDEDRTHAGLVVAGRLPDGRVGAELVEHGPGLDWVTPSIMDRRTRRRYRITADTYGPASTIVRELTALGVDVDQLDTRRYADAGAELVDDLRHRRIVIRHEEVLDVAAGLVESRQMGDRWALSRRRSAGSVAPIIALAVAAHGARRTPARAPVIALSRPA